MGGGIFSIKGNGTGSTSQTLGNVTVNAGAGQILINPNGGTGTTLTLGTITATAADGSLLIGTAQNAGTGTITTTSAKNATGIYGGRVVFTDGTGVNYNWADHVEQFALYAFRLHRLHGNGHLGGLLDHELPRNGLPDAHRVRNRQHR